MYGYLTLKAPVTTAADDIHNFFFPARQRIHMKNQALSSSKDKSKKIEMSSAAIFVCCLKG